MRIAGMWYLHAVLVLNHTKAIDLAGELRRIHSMVDNVTAWFQCKSNWYCARVPFCWQNDGHHRGDTFDYAPPD
jgi:hypothetical protein